MVVEEVEVVEVVVVVVGLEVDVVEVVVVVVVVEVVEVEVVVGSSTSHILFSFKSRQQPDPTCMYGGLHTTLLEQAVNKSVNNKRA